MSLLAKRVWSTLAAIALVAGLILNVPRAVEVILSNGPTWMRASDVIWVVACGLFIAWVWLPPRATRKVTQSVHPELHRVQDLLDRVKMFLNQHGVFIKNNNEAGLKDYLFNQINLTTPLLLKSLFGGKEAEKFTEALQHAAEASGDKLVVLTDVYLTYLTALAAAKIAKHAERIHSSTG
jgi:hypothetical protein